MIDISYIPMAKGFMYFFGILDVYSRKLLGWSLSNSMEASWVCSCISDTISRFGKPEIINSDQGSQFTSEQYIALIKSYQTIHISMDGKGRAIDNVFIERFFRTLKYDKLYLCPGRRWFGVVYSLQGVYHLLQSRKNALFDRGLYAGSILS